MATPIAYAILKERYVAQKRENERLREAIGVLTIAPKDSSDENDSDLGEEEDPEVEGEPEVEGPGPAYATSTAAHSDDETTDSGSKELAVALWDNAYFIYRCTECHGEIDEDTSLCSFCNQEHHIEVQEDHIVDALSRPMENQALSEDRDIGPRGTTPLLSLPQLTSDGLVIPEHYANRYTEYIELLQRGATRDMCEEFLLEFNQATGICAWANDEIFEEFSGPKMEEGDAWKIYLGRRIQLNEDDTDGYAFIEGILEDGIIFCPIGSKWTTIKEGPNLWVTKPLPYLEEAEDPEDGEWDEEDDQLEEESDRSSLIVKNTYAIDDDDDDDVEGEEGKSKGEEEMDEDSACETDKTSSEEESTEEDLVKDLGFVLTESASGDADWEYDSSTASQ